MAKKPADTLTAIAGLGVELAVISDKLDKLAGRVCTSERRIDESKGIPLHMIQVKEEISQLREMLARMEARQDRSWWSWFGC